MGENEKKAKKSPKRSGMNADMFWYVLPGLAIIAFFVWVLTEMGGQSSGGTLTRLLLGIAVTLGGSGLLFGLLTRFGSSK